MNLREAWAATHHAGLGWSPDVEKAIDRVAAGGFCHPLGLALWRARYQNDATALSEAQRRLERVVAGRYRELQTIRRQMAKQVLREYLIEFCTVCLGAKEVVTAKLRVVCHACDGSGIRKYGDLERADRMSISAARVRSLTGKIEWLADYVMKHDRQVNVLLNMQLERNS